ncbi:MAG TPA: ABC transporter ATP-binding protein [Bacteroidales bacterium]|nr:ABC transporter ATP-binding protein [Bacteroidales bacterium]
MKSSEKSDIRKGYTARALTFVKPYRGKIAVILILTSLVSAAGVAEPVIIKTIIDNIGSANQLSYLIYGIVLFLVVSLFSNLASAFSNWMGWDVRLNVHDVLLNEIVSRLHVLPSDFHKKEGVGSIMMKLERSIQSFVGAVSEIFLNVLPSILFLAMALVVMFRLDWRMTLLVLVFAPVPTLIAWKASPKQVKREKFLMNQWGRIYSRFNEVLSSIVTVRSFAMEDNEKMRFMHNVTRANGKVKKGVYFDSLIGSGQKFITVLARIAALGAGAYLIMSHEMTIGTLVAFLTYISALFGPVNSLTNTYRVLKNATVSLEHIFGILDNQEFIGDKPDAVELKNTKGEIRFENVSFRYRNSQCYLLDDLNFRINPGQSVAIVGPSGSGKSTIISLIQRFYDPEEGAIYLDGKDLRDIKQKSLRNSIGIVLQEPLLFNESIRNNIAYGKKDATIEEIMEAAKVANIHERIMEMPDGYLSMAGERGSNLSLGERQRVAIARAVLLNPPILILDEATASLDLEVEASVQKAIEKLSKNRTTITIAHRLSTIVKSDVIMVLKNGKIIESGTHLDLMHKKSHYKSLVDHLTSGLLAS